MQGGPKQSEEASVPPRHQASAQVSEAQYPLQPVPSRLGPNSVLSLPPYRMPPALTNHDLDTIVKLRQQLSGENGLLTRLSSFMQAQRSTDQRQIAGALPCIGYLILRFLVCVDNLDSEHPWLNISELVLSPTSQLVSAGKLKRSNERY